MSSKLKNNTVDLQALLVAIEELPDADTTEYDVYDGTYTVTPAVDQQQTLKTSQKLMQADVIVNAIPYAEVTNASNGKTVTIG